MLESRLPALVAALRSYSWVWLRADVIAGITVAFVALPLAIAFGIASGVTPQAGLFTAIVGGAIVSLLGGSRVQIAGPTGAFVVIVSGIVAAHGLDGLLTVAMMAGVILVLLGITGLGSAIAHVPRPVIVGFTNGISLLIATTQLRDFFGLRIAGNPSEFFARTLALARAAGTLDPATTLVAIGTMLGLIVLPRMLPRVPPAIVALVATTVIVWTLHLHIATIGSHFGALPRSFPPLHVPTIRFELVGTLLPSAFTVAILAAIESLLSAVVADGLSNERHNANVELVAQGVANLAVPFVGGIPVTGAIARTATNVRAGARTPVAGIVHSFALLAIVLVAAPLVAFVPMASLAAILLVVAYRMGEWREVGAILRLDTAARSVWLVTFVLTVVADLTVAVEVGIVLAALLSMYRLSRTTTVSLVTPAYVEEGVEHSLQHHDLPDFVSVLRIHGPFLFGTTEALVNESVDLTRFAEIVVLRLRNMTAIDSTGLRALEIFHDRLTGSGRQLLLCGARDQPARFLRSGNFAKVVGAENILGNVRDAIARARDLHERAVSGRT
jgi:SulP family sulfate permease